MKLLEKLMIVHHAATAGDVVEQTRLAQHYHDIWCLLQDEAVLSALNSSPVDVLAREVVTFSEAAGLGTTPRPANGFTAPAAFDPAHMAAAKEASIQRLFPSWYGQGPTPQHSKTAATQYTHTLSRQSDGAKATVPVRTVRAWLEVLGRHETLTPASPVWRPIRGRNTIGAEPLSTDGIAQVVKRRMTATGITASEWGGHSLRRGHATEAARNGASDRSIMATGDWASVRSVDGYVAAGTLFDDPSSAHLDL